MGIIQNECEFLRAQPDVERQQNAARFEYSIIRFQQTMTVGTEEGNSVAGLCAGGDEYSRQSCGALSQFLVGEALVAADDSDLVGKLFAGVTEESNGSQRDLHTHLALGERLT